MSMPAEVLRRMPSAALQWATTRRLSRWASVASAVISSCEYWQVYRLEAGVSEPPVAMTLTKLASCCTSVRTALITSSLLSARLPSQLQCPAVVVIGPPATSLDFRHFRHPGRTSSFVDYQR